ncbi:hypothetical protein PPBDW_I21117 [Photobacterium kishitanii]|nr:hypothetical protein PPBDW_I21117 [Photobacterium kishitanii]
MQVLIIGQVMRMLSAILLAPTPNYKFFTKELFRFNTRNTQLPSVYWGRSIHIPITAHHESGSSF